MAKQLTGYALLRSVCTEEEKKELTKAKRAAGVSGWSDEECYLPSDVLNSLFWWRFSPQGWDYWKSLRAKLLYLEASKGW